MGDRNGLICGRLAIRLLNRDINQAHFQNGARRVRVVLPPMHGDNLGIVAIANLKHPVFKVFENVREIGLACRSDGAA